MAINKDDSRQLTSIDVTAYGIYTRLRETVKGEDLSSLEFSYKDLQRALALFKEEVARISQSATIGRPRSLSDAQITEVKSFLWDGLEQTSIAVDMGVSQMTVSRVQMGLVGADVAWPDGTRGAMPASQRQLLRSRAIEDRTRARLIADRKIKAEFYAMDREVDRTVKVADANIRSMQRVTLPQVTAEEIASITGNPIKPEEASAKSHEIPEVPEPTSDQPRQRFSSMTDDPVVLDMLEKDGKEVAEFERRQFKVEIANMPKQKIRMRKKKLEKTEDELFDQIFDYGDHK